ncbi:hypothetical protein OSTOST_05791 [Ostertagia ostertagi]
MDVYEEMRRLRRIKEAIPPLPEPYTLYNKIVHRSMELRIATRFMSDLFNRIQELRISKESPKERWVQLKLLETLREKTYAEFALLRSEIRMLFTAVPLVIALELISEDDWDALITKPQRDDRGKALVLDQHQLERVMTDQFDILEEYRLMLAELRHEIKDEESHQAEDFQKSVLSALKDVSESVKAGFRNFTPSNDRNDLEELRNIVQNETSKLQEDITLFVEHVRNTVVEALSKLSAPTTAEERTVDNPEDASDGEGEGTEVLQPETDSPDKMEAQIIQQNVEFMENVGMDDEEEYEALRWQRRRQIDRKLYDAYVEIQELDELISELEKEPKCEPRDFKRGLIRRWDEKTIRCVFCDRVGIHYSDSCDVYKESSVRRLLLDREHRCSCCLEIKLTHHDCRKINVGCYHCKRHGHHSAICDLPERTEEINKRKAEALCAKGDAEKRIKELKEQLEELYRPVHPA